MSKLTRACAFVDWHNIENIVLDSTVSRVEQKISRGVLKVQQQVARILTKQDSTKNYRVAIRVYHGWHSGETATHRLHEFNKALAKDDFSRSLGRVSFSPGLAFGNMLACESRRGPLYSTSRDGQKMVDTAITSDFLFMLKTGRIEAGIIVSDDDDFIPALFTAEEWGLNGTLLRSQGRTLENVTKNPIDVPVHYWD